VTLVLHAGEASIGQARAITVAFSGDGVSQQAVLPPNISSFKGLLEFVRRTFKQQARTVTYGPVAGYLLAALYPAIQ
jgi:hypothetical protein